MCVSYMVSSEADNNFRSPTLVSEAVAKLHLECGTLCRRRGIYFYSYRLCVGSVTRRPKSIGIEFDGHVRCYAQHGR